MATAFLSLAVVCLLAALVGGRVKALGVEIPLLHSAPVRVGVALFGASLIVWVGRDWIPEAYERLQRAERERLDAALVAYDQGNWGHALAEFAELSGCRNEVAMYHYGEMLYHGEGATRDVERALVWLRKSAESGHAAAQASLATILVNCSESTHIDPTAWCVSDPLVSEEARTWSARSASQGDAYGQYVHAFFLGSFDDTRRVLSRSAGAGYAPAQYLLSNILAAQRLDGGGTLSDTVEIIDLMKKATDQRDANAELAAAEALEKEDPHNAYAYALLSRQNYLGRIGLLNAQHRARAEDLVRRLEARLPRQEVHRIAQYAHTKTAKPSFHYRHGH